MKMRRRNPACAHRNCYCRCHWDAKGYSHCHMGRKCREITCTCGKPLPTPPLSALFPRVSVTRGGITYGMPPTQERTFDPEVIKGNRAYWTEGPGSEKPHFPPPDKGVLYIPEEIIPVPGYNREHWLEKIAAMLDIPVYLLARQPLPDNEDHIIRGEN